ncbi:MAG TPA: hypothetical protein VEG67_00270, partial [Myxococcota bacterium]|nr:hypothetical protein [Myxococcota bacterium]
LPLTGPPPAAPGRSPIPVHAVGRDLDPEESTPVDAMPDVSEGAFSYEARSAPAAPPVLPPQGPRPPLPPARSPRGAPAPGAGRPGPLASAAAAPVNDGLGEERAKAERLARIIVSDVILYNQEKFTRAIASGRVLEMLDPDLEEGRALFRQRIDARVREERDHLAEELVRVARTRGMR